MITLREGIETSLGIVNQAEVDEDTVGIKLKDHFQAIAKETNDLMNSKKLQFLSESKALT